MKTLITWVVVAVVVLGLAFTVFPWSKDYFWQTRGDIDQGFADRVRSRNLVDNARTEIVEQLAKLQGKYAEILVAKERLNNIARERDGLQVQLAKHESALGQGLVLLEAHTGPTIPVNGQDLSRERVIADVNRRAELCERLRVRFQTAQTSYQMLFQAIEQGMAAISDSKAQLESQKADLSHIEVLLQSGEAIAEVKALAQSLVGTGINVDENRYFKEIRSRLAQAQAAIEFGGLSDASGEFLSYDGLSVSTPVDAAMAYRSKYLGSPVVPTAVVVTEPATDSAGFLELDDKVLAAPDAE